MMIRLTIENAERLPAGAPLAFSARGSGFEIGRTSGDWVLPDPDNVVSGRHCEVRYQAGAFWLHDVSRNGTFVNGASERLAGPHRLADGDRLRIGRYIVSVSLADDRADVAGVPPSPASGHRNPPAAAERTGAGVTLGVGRAGSSITLQREPFAPRTEAAASPAAHRSASPSPAAAGPGVTRADDLLRYVAAGAGISPETLSQRDPAEVATEIGAVLRLVVEELAQLLKARAAAKVLARSGHRTMIGSVENNPLKFVPTAEEILDIMFARRRAGYLDAKQSIEEAFRDLKSHELATYAAMQMALAQLLDDLSPETIEKKTPASSFGSRKSRAWDTFVATWTAREEAHENGMLDIFLAYFSEAYAKASKQK